MEPLTFVEFCSLYQGVLVAPVLVLEEGDPVSLRATPTPVWTEAHVQKTEEDMIAHAPLNLADLIVKVSTKLCFDELNQWTHYVGLLLPLDSSSQPIFGECHWL